MLTWLILSACRDVQPESESNATTTESSIICEIDDDCPNGTICEGDGTDADCVDGDRNNSPEEAVSMLWEDSVSETINPSGDVDYFKFNARGGEYVRISTASEFEDADTVVVLRDPFGQVMTWSDDFPTGSSVSSLDSVVYAYLPYQGEYLISVEDYYAFMNPDNSYGTRDYTYSLSLEMWNQATQEPDAIDGSMLQLALDSANMWNSVGILIDEAGDSDFIEVQYSAKDSEGNDAKFLSIAGMIHLDGSDLTPQVRLYDANKTLLATLDGVGPDGTLQYPDMTEGTYYVQITDANAQGGEAYWTYMFLISRANTPYPVEIGENGSMETAQAIEMVPLQTDSGSDYAVGRQMGTLLDSNADWFQFDHTFSEGQLIVCMNAPKYGSTAVPLVEIYDTTGTPISSEECDPSSDPNLATVLDNVPEGSMYIAVSDTDASDLSDWYQLLVFSTSFEATSFACP